MECLGPEALEKIAGRDSDPESRAHLDSCGACRAALLALRDETNLLGDLRRALDADTGRARIATDAPPGYTLVGLLARGGQGEILEGFEVASGRRVAIKLLVRGHLATSAQRARFLREIKLTRSLEHPGLVRVYEAGETPSGRPFLAMELVRGRHLDAWADEQRRQSAGDPTRRILEVFLAMCEAVAYAHSRGVVHRDLKPSNILVDEEGRPKVLDLGLAKSLEPIAARKSTESLRTRTGEVLGTLAWMAPERLAGEKDAGPRSDIYCLGLLLHRVVLGRPTPLRSAEGPDAASVRGAGRAAPRTGSSQDSQLVAGCREILARALALTPSERHANAGELAAHLRALLAGARVRSRGRFRALPAAVVLALVSLASGLVWWAVGPRTTSRFAEAGSDMLKAVELARQDGAGAYEHLLDATERLISAPPDERGRWDPPEADSSELSRWRIAASHIWRRYPARLRLALDARETWTLTQESGASDSLWLTRDGETLSRIDLGSTPRWTDLELAPRGAGSIGYVQLSNDGRWMCIGYKAASETWERDLVELGPAGATRLVRELGTASFAAWARTHDLCVVLGAEGGSVQLWDPERPEPLAAFELPSGGPPLAACFAEEDRELIVLDHSTRSFRFAIPTGQPLGEGPSLLGTADIRALGGGWILRIGEWLAVTHLQTGRSHQLGRVGSGARVSVLDGPRIVAIASGQMRVWRSTQRSTELEDWVECETWKVSAATRSFATLAAGRSAATLDVHGVLTVRDMQASGLPRVLDRAVGGATLHDLEFSREGAGWITCRGNEIVLQAGGTLHPMPITEPEDLVFCLAQGAKGQIVFGTRAGRVGYVETGGSRASRLLHQGSLPVTALDVDPSRRFAAWGDQLGTVYFQALDEDAPRYTKVIPPGTIRIPRLAFDRGGELIAGTLRDGRVFWWRPGSDPIPTGHADASASHALAFHPVEDRLVTGHDGDRLAIWDSGALAPSEVHVISSEADKSSIWALAFDPRGRFLAIGSGRRVTVWDWELRRTLFWAEDHDGYIFGLAFHPTLPILASAAELGELFEWDFRAADHLRDGAGARIQPAASLR